MNLSFLRRVGLGVAVATLPVYLFAQSSQTKPAGATKTPKPTAPKSGPSKPLSDADLASAKPGRDPNQPIDEEYTRKIKEYTTAPYFLSPLVDYMPAAKGIPTPKETLGDIAGAPGKLPYSIEVYDYMRLLAKSTPRVRPVRSH